MPSNARWLLPLVLSAAACASGPRPSAAPERFTSGIDPRFPPSRYVVGLGQGETLELARHQAAASIAAQLQAAIRATDWIASETAWSQGGDGVATSGSERVLQEIRVETRFERLSWIRTADVLVDGRRVFVLCVLDRQAAALELETAIEDQLSIIRQRIEGAADPLHLSALAHEVEGLRRLRTALLPQLELLLTLRRQASPSPWPTGGEAEARLASTRASSLPPELRAIRVLEERLQALRRAMVLQVCIDGEGDERLAHRFGAALASAGLRVAPCADEIAGGWRLLGRYQARAIPMRNAGGFPFFCSTRLVFQLVDRETGEVAIGGSERGRRAGGMSPGDACQASLELLAAGLARAVGAGDDVESR